MRAFPIHVDSPMAIDATRIYAAHPEGSKVGLNNIGGRSLLHGKWVQLHRTRAESEALNRMKGPAVVISSSGMLSGGRILHHCRQRLPHPENTLLITGYQAAGTLGRALLDGAGRVRIHKGEVPVLAEIRDLKGLSARWRGEMMRWLSGVRRAPRAIFVTHGEAEAATTLASRVARERGFEARVPAHGESFDLAPGAAGGPGSEVL
jgi:metallo-beta-lactamase family protein